jgi:endonuclease/exonuclease/phosphatase family metal-dependent hydrolase
MRILSYNIHKGIGGRDRRYQLDRIIHVIEHENPDLICLQEVDRNVRRSRFDNQPRILSKTFHMDNPLYQMNVHLKTGGYGNLILSRWPIISHHHISIKLKKKKARGAQIAVVETPEGSFQLVNWHLGLADSERHWQVNHLLNHRLFLESEDLPSMIIGDFNDWRNSLEKADFKENGFHQITHPPSRFRSFPAYVPVGSLDKSYFRGNLLVREARIVKSKVAKAASDHCPLVIDFHLNGNESS